jgi:hypothetical protein
MISTLGGNMQHQQKGHTHKQRRAGRIPRVKQHTHKQRQQTRLQAATGSRGNMQPEWRLTKT